MKRSPSLILLIASILFVLCGIGYGFTSHIVAYRHVGKNTIAHYLASNGIGYLQMTHSSTLYIVQETAFHPAINGIHTFADGNTISFVYDPDHSTPINVKSTLGTHLSGNAYNVVEITAYDNHNQVYATVAYSKGSQGYYKNNWLFGGILILFGLLLAGASFFFRVRSKPAVALKQAQEIIPTSDVVPSQPQEQQPGITEQDTAPHPASSPSAVTPEQLMMPRQPVQPPQTAFTNQIAATYPPAISNPPSFAGFSTQLLLPQQTIHLLRRAYHHSLFPPRQATRPLAAVCSRWPDSNHSIIHRPPQRYRHLTCPHQPHIPNSCACHNCLLISHYPTSNHSPRQLQSHKNHPLHRIHREIVAIQRNKSITHHRHHHNGKLTAYGPDTLCA